MASALAPVSGSDESSPDDELSDVSVAVVAESDAV